MLTLTAIGAADGIGERSSPGDDIDLQFHRWQARITRTLPGFELGSSIYLGYEEGVLGQELSARSGRLGPTVWVEIERESTRAARGRRHGCAPESPATRTGQRSRHSAMSPGQAGAPGSLPDLRSDLSLQTGPADFVGRAPLAGVGERNAFGAYVELGLAADSALRSRDRRARRHLAHARPSRDLERPAYDGALSPQPRAPAARRRWNRASNRELAAADPGAVRLLARRGVQGALQSEVGADIQLPLALSLSATGFYHRYTHLVFMELILDCEGNTDPLAAFVRTTEAKRTPLCSRDRPAARRRRRVRRRAAAQAQPERTAQRLGQLHAGVGARDRIRRHRLRPAVRRAPRAERRAQVRLVATASRAALRLHYRSGKPAVNTIYDFTAGHFDRVDTRLPPFVRLDLNLAYHWPTSWGRLWLMLQWMNVTFSREATKRDCRLSTSLDVACRVDYQPAIVLPNAGVRAEFLRPVTPGTRRAARSLRSGGARPIVLPAAPRVRARPGARGA